MDEGTPALAVGFAIDTDNAFGSLKTLDDVIGTTAAKAVRDFDKIEAASRTAVNLSGPTAQIIAFGNAETRELANAARARAAAEKSGEAMVRQMQRSVETFGKSASEIRNMRAELRALEAEERGLTELAGRIRTLNAEMIRLESGQGGVTNGAIKNRMAMQGASYQVQDFFTQVSMGANPMNAFAVQGAQLAGQFSNVEGKAGSVARFFMGPWGLAITAALMLFGPFVGKLFDGNNELDKAIDKLKKDAAETETTARAKERFSHTQEGVNQAIREGNEAIEKSIAAQRSAAEQANIAAKNNLAEANTIRVKTQARLADAKAMLEAQVRAAQAPGTRGEVAALGLQTLLGQIAKIEADLAINADRIIANEKLVQNTRIELAVEQGKRMADPIAKINKLYDDQIIAATNAARAQVAAGGEVTTALGDQITAIERARNAAIKAENDKQHATRQTAQVGREVDLAEARRIAQGIGARITSDRRTYDEQKRLYEKYIAWKQGRGPWAALAAAPGTSDHEHGNALDIAKTPGMSLGKIRQAFRDAGVSVKQLLDEGSHFHVSWKKGADGAAAASKKLADTQADLARRFDPATAAAMEYAKALKDIAAAKLDPATAAQYAEKAAEAFRKARADAFELPSMADIIPQAETEKAAEKSAEEFQRNVIQPLKDELALYGLVGPARAAAALELEKQGFLAANMDQGIEVATARWLEYYRVKSELIAKDSAADKEAAAIKRACDEMERMIDVARSAGDAMAHAFGKVGGAIADAIDVLMEYRKREQENAELAKKEGWDQARVKQEASQLQLESMGALAGAAKSMFKEHSAGYQAMAAAEKAFALIQLANTAKSVAAGAAKMFASLGPWAFPAVAAMVAVMAGLGFFGGGAGSAPKLPESNTGTGTVLGNSTAQSDSIKNAIDALKDVDTLTNNYARQMAASLRSIESQIGGLASLVVRSGDISANANVTQGFKPNVIGSVLGKIPLIGGFLSSLFGSTTTVTGSGLYAGPQSLAGILGGGFDASYYSDVQKKSKFLGITTGTKNYTEYTGADGGLETQFALLLRQFNDAIVAAAVPLGAATDDIQNRLNGFVVNLGRIDLKGLTGDQIKEKLEAVFGAAADGMAAAAFPGIERFQKVGEGAFETLVRVASTVEAVTNALDALGDGARSLGIEAKLGLADQFETISDLTSAISGYFEAFYTQEEQAAARTAQLASVFASLGLAMPATLAAYRQLVEAQDLNTLAGQETYATLLRLAPAFADLKSAMEGAKSAADIVSERQDLQRQLLELRGDTAALRALELAKLDSSNRALQQEIWAIQDAQEAAKAADELRQAWVSVGDSIMDEVNRIRGLSGAETVGFASIMGRFNAATEAARAGDIEAAKTLPGLSQALLTAAAEQATSRQELARIQAQTAASLEATNAAINGRSGLAAATGAASSGYIAVDVATLAQATSTPTAANDGLADGLRALREEVAGMRAENNTGHATTAGNTGRIARKLDDVTAESGGDAISMVASA